jgi:hypothetical protein
MGLWATGPLVMHLTTYACCTPYKYWFAGGAQVGTASGHRPGAAVSALDCRYGGRTSRCSFHFTRCSAM